MGILRHPFDTEPGTRNCRSPHFLLGQSPRSARGRGLGATSGLPQACAQPSADAWPSRSQECARASESPREHLLPQLFLFRFWLGCCLCRLLSITGGSRDVQSLGKSSPGRGCQHWTSSGEVRGRPAYGVGSFREPPARPAHGCSWGRSSAQASAPFCSLCTVIFQGCH